MAASADVPVVPVTISDLARWYPKGTLLPIGVPTDVVVTIHPPVHTSGPNKVSESEAIAQTYDAVRTPAPSAPPPPALRLPLPLPLAATLALHPRPNPRPNPRPTRGLGGGRGWAGVGGAAQRRTPAAHRFRMLDRRPVLLRARSTLPCRPTRGGRPIASSK